MITFQLIANWIVRSFPETLVSILFLNAFCNKKVPKKTFLTFCFLISFLTGIMSYILPVTQTAFNGIALVVGLTIYSSRVLGLKISNALLVTFVPLALIVFVCDVVSVLFLQLFGIGPELIQTRQTHIMALSSFGLLTMFIPITLLNRLHAKKNKDSINSENTSKQAKSEDTDSQSIWSE